MCNYVQMWVEPVVTFWAWAAGSWASCSPASCVQVWAHPASQCSHAAYPLRGRALKRTLKPWDHHSAGTHGPWNRRKTIRQTEEQSNVGFTVFLFLFWQHVFKSFKTNQPIIIVKVIWTTPAVVFTPLTLPTSPLRALEVGHPVRVYAGRI